MRVDAGDRRIYERTFTAKEGARTHKISMQLEIEDTAELVNVITGSEKRTSDK
jgi:hypothetical protein